MYKLFDSHAHYNDLKYNETDGGADALLSSSEFAENVGHVINVGVDIDTDIEVIEQAAKYPFMYCAVGIHPQNCNSIEGDPDNEILKLEELLGDEENRRRKKIVALGEIGLDYYWEHDKAKELEYFDKQLTLSERLNMPVVIHDRDAHGDTFDMIRQHKGAYGVFHSYSGSAEMAREYIKMGWYISFSGVVSFKNAEKVKETALIVPDDRILIETDCPYLTPVPFRGKTNNSMLMRYTANALAEIRSDAFENIVEKTSENAKRLFKIQ